jgi:protein phosphatase
MGTTLAGIAFSRDAAGDAVVAFNVGDSRVYRSSQGALAQVSSDHSVVAELVHAGAISAAAAERHPDRNIVTRALGLEGSVDVDSWTLPAQPGDAYLVCSDGLTNEVPDAELAEVLATVDDPTSCAERLLELAFRRGAHDNVSAVVVRLEAESKSHDGS